MTERQLLQEIQQVRRPLSLGEETFLELWRTSEFAVAWVSRALKPFGLSIHQYNVLRILRGTAPRSLTSGEVAARMVSRVPDSTRLLNRLAGKNLIKRKSDRWDRRVVLNKISEQGERLVAEATEGILAAHETGLRALDAPQREALIDLLEAIRHPPAS